MFHAKGVAFGKDLREEKAWPIQKSQVGRTRRRVAKDVARAVTRAKACRVLYPVLRTWDFDHGVPLMDLARKGLHQSCTL